MDQKELKALRRPFLKELFRQNKFNLFMTVLAAVLTAVAGLVVSWLIKEVADLIAGESRFKFWMLLIIACAAFGLFALAWVIDRIHLTKFRAKAMQQYRAYVFERLMEKGIQAFSGENSSLYLSALSNDVNTIETDFLAKLQNTVVITVSFVGALGLMIFYSPLLTLIAIGFSLLPIFVSVLFRSPNNLSI